jgi:exonuclease 3'-5' domain-containing protein 1
MVKFLIFQAAHAVIQQQETGKPVYKVKNVSLNALCELYDAPVNPMKEQVIKKI